MYSQQTHSMKNEYHRKRNQESMDIVANVLN